MTACDFQLFTLCLSVYVCQEKGSFVGTGEIVEFEKFVSSSEILLFFILQHAIKWPFGSFRSLCLLWCHVIVSANELNTFFLIFVLGGGVLRFLTFGFVGGFFVLVTLSLEFLLFSPSSAVLIFFRHLDKAFWSFCGQLCRILVQVDFDFIFFLEAVLS